MLSNSANYFFKANTSAGSNEGECYVVNRLSRLQEDVCSELIVINNIRCVIGLIANDEIIDKSSLRLDITEVRIDDVSEVRSCQLIAL